MTDSDLPCPTAIIFDWDNTLVDTWGTITAALNKVRALNGQEAWTIDEARFKSSRSLKVSFPEWYGNRWEEMRDVFYAHVEAVHLETLRIMPGAAELLLWLHERHMPMFVVSTKRNTLLRAEVVHMGWGGFFKAVVGSYDASRDKPDRAPVDMALAAINRTADDPYVWLVGDSDSDVICARNSGCTPVFIGEKAMAEKLGAKHYFSDCNTMKTALNKWNCFKSTLG